MDELDDNTLLREYVAQNSHPAFAALVTRHVNKVYSVAMRHTGNAARAEEITQAVFVILAQKARTLSQKVILSGWLYQTARLTAVTFVRAETRRARREQEAHMLTDLNEPEADVWLQIAPLLDEAISELNETDRHAVVLRFFDGKSMKDVGAVLGASEDATKMRVSRALDKLREVLEQRGIRTTAAALSIVVTSNAVQAAPIGLATTISATALMGTTVATSTAIATAKTIAMTTFQKMAVTVALTATVGIGIYEAKQAHNAQGAVEKLQAKQAPMWEQIQQLQSNLSGASNAITGLKEDFTKNQKDNSELLKLRGEVGVLRNQLQQAKAGQKSWANQLFTKGQLRPAGFDTPEAALQTFVAAMVATNYDALLEAIAPDLKEQSDTPEMRQKFQVEVAKAAENLAEFQGIQIIAQKYIEDDRADLETLFFLGTNAPDITIQHMVKVDGVWKFYGQSKLPQNFVSDRALGDIPSRQNALNQTKMMLAKKATIACTAYAINHEGQYPSSLQATELSTSTNFWGEFNANFDLVYTGTRTNIAKPAETIVIKEKQAWQSADGIWLKTYGFADGHAELHAGKDGEFDDWESQHIIKP